jgi:hypothetical protein
MYYFYLGIVALLVFSGCAIQKDITLSPWKKQAIVIDGQLSDWEQPLIRPAKNSDFSYRISNDKAFLYLAVRITSKSVQQNIMRYGLTIWVDKKGKRNEKVGIGYPLALSEPQIQEIARSAALDKTSIGGNALDRAYAKNCVEFELVGWVEETLRVSNLASQDIKTAADFDDIGALLLEYKLPLTELLDVPLAYDKYFSVGLKVNNPPERAEDDPGLFNDPSNNGITQSNQGMQGNRSMRGNPYNMAGRQPAPSPRRGRQTMASRWIYLQLSLQP